jgi:hypothetical protein
MGDSFSKYSSEMLEGEIWKLNPRKFRISFLRGEEDLKTISEFI